MDLKRMIAELKAERERIESAILALERLARGEMEGKRGRPPKWLRDLALQEERESAPLAKAAQANGKK